jgi:hypothetical protein
MVNVPEQWYQLLASWSDELLSTTERIHHLIGGRHWPTEGNYREALLRRLLRRVLPDRFRVSTGFIYRWNENPSRQLDVLIWDAQEHSALLEEGELVILTPDAVAAIIEVKSSLNKKDLRDALALLSPPWLINWRYTPEQSKSGRQQQVIDVPLRAIFAFTGSRKKPETVTRTVFTETTTFYRNLYSEDAKLILGERGQPRLRWVNLIDAICIANLVEIEQTSLTIEGIDGELYNGPGLAAFPAQSSAGNLAVGKFCMYLLWYLRSWTSDDASDVTFRAPWAVTTYGVCCFASLAGAPTRVRLWGNETDPEYLWHPDPPLWLETGKRD